MRAGDYPPETSDRDQVSCPRCNTIYSIPHTKKALRITCTHCQTVFYRNLPQPPNERGRKYLLPAITAAVVILVVLIVQLSAKRTSSPSSPAISSIAELPKVNNSPLQGATSSNWITISYSGLVDGSTLTHGGETVSEVVRKIPDYDEELKGLVQQYLEPFSLLCHDVLLSSGEPDTLPLVNITSYYPIGSEQPAWASLFREGHFQLYYNDCLVRLFLKGSNPARSFDEDHSVVRHAIQDVINRHPTSIKKLEVYVFTNDYAHMELRFNTVPAVYSVEGLDLSAKLKHVDLESIDNFLKEGVILEAVEVDGNNDLYFYGRRSHGQTIAGSPLSLADIAVIYRSVFHFGNNAPYISLDKHEDNRLAKVNFGGHLENTRVGHVVLEADKLFKTLSTGLDPNTHEIMKSAIANYVSGFLTEDERSLLENHTEGHSLIRYWFYPDSIGTVTDGTIGVVLTNQFRADVERMDVKIGVSEATRKTIDHLNRHFDEYENAEKTYTELSTVGRVMALVNWLRGMNITEKVELDDFLSVLLPAFTTPEHTRKMLAVSAIAYAKDLPPNEGSIRGSTRVFYLSQLLDRYESGTKDERFMEIASRSVPDISTLAFPQQKVLKSRIDLYEPLIRENEPTIASLERVINQQQHTLDRTSEYEVDSYNTLVERYNILIETQKTYIDIYNEAIRELKDMDVTTRQITSIGGGIDLSPKEFKLIARDLTSPRLREVTGIKNMMRAAGKVARSGDWLRSNVTKGAARVNLPPRSAWTSSKTIDGKITYSYHSNSGDVISMSTFPEWKEWESNVSVNKSHDMVKFSKTANRLQVTHTGFSSEFKGQVSSDGRRVVFSK